MIGPSGDWPEELDDLVPGSDLPRRRPAAVGSDDVIVVDVVTVSGQAMPVEFLIGPDAVEVWFRWRRSAVIDRRVLRWWLAHPRLPLVVDEVAFSLDRMVDAAGRVALSLPDVLVWTLEPQVLARLRERV